MAGIFKAYDIRGVYGDTLTEELGEKIGRAYATLLKCKKVVVGRDMRPHSKPLFEALARGLTLQGCDVVDLGMCSTPMSYYGNGLLDADGSVMITASHNPGEWNGFKLCRAQAVPISGVTGILDVERIVNEETFDAPAETVGTVSTYDIVPEYIAHVKKHAHLQRPVRIAVDMANAMGIYEARAFEGVLDFDPLFGELDGSFPNHEANPLQLDTLESVQKMVREGGYDFGIAFDGDADRAGFVDEKGNVIPMDIITALIAEDLLAEQKGVVFYDLRSSWSVKEVIEENGGTPMMSRVGHAFIKQQMRDEDAMFAGELSGHYYFRDNYYTESSAMATFCVANIVSRSDKPLSELVAPIQRYVASGEINSTVADTEAVLNRIREKYTDGNMFELDGVSVDYEDWWFNVRCSNTEPLVRLNLEAPTQEKMAEKRDELLALIRE
ncbi:MAG: phosphomannomutase/phosphoglucomutase [Kiritimatiellae bacterium]|nr:phosphomannomutase/phosphoglucomutase [Kiritimatiellia bacterium]